MASQRNYLGRPISHRARKDQQLLELGLGRGARRTERTKRLEPRRRAGGVRREQFPLQHVRRTAGCSRRDETLKRAPLRGRFARERPQRLGCLRAAGIGVQRPHEQRLGARRIAVRDMEPRRLHPHHGCAGPGARRVADAHQKLGGIAR